MKVTYALIFFVVVCVSLSFKNSSHADHERNYKNNKIITGADQTEKYVPFLKGKRVAILANLTTPNHRGKVCKGNTGFVRTRIVEI